MHSACLCHWASTSSVELLWHPGDSSMKWAPLLKRRWNVCWIGNSACERQWILVGCSPAEKHCCQNGHWCILALSLGQRIDAVTVIIRHWMSVKKCVVCSFLDVGCCLKCINKVLVASKQTVWPLHCQNAVIQYIYVIFYLLQFTQTFFAKNCRFLFYLVQHFVSTWQ